MNYMSDFAVEREKRKDIIQKTYKEFKNKEKQGKTRSATISSIVSMIKKELKENAN